MLGRHETKCQDLEMREFLDAAHATLHSLHALHPKTSAPPKPDTSPKLFFPCYVTDCQALEDQEFSNGGHAMNEALPSLNLRTPALPKLATLFHAFRAWKEEL